MTKTLAFALATIALAAFSAQAQIQLRQVPLAERYAPGGTLDIEVSLDVLSAEQVNAAGLEQVLPTGWSFDSIVSGDAPGVVPDASAAGTIDFIWFPLPAAFPVTFVYRLAIAANATGTQNLTMEAIVLLNDSGEVRATEQDLMPRQGDGPFHTADRDLSNSIEIDELLRLIQFYNTGGFHCADFPTDTEDGYVPGALGNKACAFHDSDYNPQDWNVDLDELVRAIQFYNSLAYFACPGQDSEDGYCPGPPL